MGLKAHLDTAPFGQRALDCFHPGQELPELGYREIEQLREADFPQTVRLLFPGWINRAYISLYAAACARGGFSPQQLWTACLRRHRWRRLVGGWPIVLLAVLGAALWLGGPRWGLAAAAAATVLLLVILSGPLVREAAPGKG